MSQVMYWEMPSMLAVRLRWVSITPFGSPVVPEVNMISTRSSGAISTGEGDWQVTDSELQLLEGDLRQAKVQAVLGGEARREGQFGCDSGDDALDVVRRAAQVQGHGDDARSEAAEEDEHPLRRVRPPDDDLVALGQSPALQEGRHLPRLGPQTVVGPAQVPKPGLEQDGIVGAEGVDATPEELDDGATCRGTCAGLPAAFPSPVCGRTGAMGQAARCRNMALRAAWPPLRIGG